MAFAKIDKYDLVEQVGHGGMAAVYKAVHPQFKKYVAIKEIRSELANNSDIQRRFEQEAELLAQLPAHPNIVTVRDALVWKGRLYLVLDYIEGGTLRDLVEQGGVDPAYGGLLLDQILSGLEAIHDRGIIHRDLKASNILIDQEGTAHITDFGISETIGGGSYSVAMATAKYAAPELLDSGLNPDGYDQQIDIYAAGVLAYEMLLGENRFRKQFPEVYNGPPEDVAERWLKWHTSLARTASNLNDLDSEIPAPLANIVGRMMAKDVNQRYRDAGEARRDLAAAMLGFKDQRGRRSGPREDDATVPIDRLRQGGARPARPAPPRPRPAVEPPAPREPGEQIRPQSARTPFRLPSWARWAALAAAVLLVAVFVWIFFFISDPGFTLVVKGDRAPVPFGSEVLVNGVPRGIPATDGTIRVSALKADDRHTVQVKYNDQLYETSPPAVTGDDGDEKVVSVNISGEGGMKLPPEITYNGSVMVLVPAGEFIMGSNNGEPNEAPEHPVRLPDYYIDKFEVTNARYREFCGKINRCPIGHPLHEQYFNDPSKSDFPVIGVSWDEADAYAKSVGNRLPTEQEWEKAAGWDWKAKKKLRWAWGDNRNESLANLSGEGSRVDQYNGDKSSYGVFDMMGNASEWVADYYQPYPGSNYSDPDYGKHRVVRGGNFGSKSIDFARTTYRTHEPPERKADPTWKTAIGFRCMVPVDDAGLQQFLRSRNTK